MRCQNGGAMVSKLPGPVCVSQALVSIEDGTLARVCSAQPGVATIPNRLGTSVFNKLLAASCASAMAQPKPTGLCARYVLAAVAKGFGALDASVDPSGIHAAHSVTRIEKRLSQVFQRCSPPISVPEEAKNYGKVLQALGFRLMDTSSASVCLNSQTGDVIVFQPPASESKAAGHIQITDGGGQWVSDFKQKDSLWPNSDPNSTWQKETPSYSIYRYPDQ